MKFSSQITNKRTASQKNPSLIPEDKIYKFLEPYSVFRVWISAIILYAIIHTSVGFTMAHKYQGEPFTNIYNPAEIVNGINVLIFFWPMVWALYRWFPSYTYQVSLRLENKGLLKTSKGKRPLSGNLTVRIKHNFNQRWLRRLSVIGTIVTSLIFFIYAVPKQTELVGKISFWYYKPLSYILFVILFTFSNYILFLMLFRQVFALTTIANFFKEPGSVVKIYPLHPDRCGGFFEIGSLSFRISLIAVLVFLWGLIYAYHPLLIGGKPLWPIVILVYIVFPHIPHPRVAKTGNIR